MKRTIRHVVGAALAVALMAFCASGTLKADTIPLDANCQLQFVAYLNGYVMISFTGSTALTLSQCEIQTRDHGADDDSWSAVSTVDFTVLGPGGTDNKFGKYCNLKTSLLTNSDVRFRALSASGETDWITQEDVRVERFPLTPVGYERQASYTGGTLETMLKDGAQNAIVELGAAAGEYVQFDLGKAQSVAGLRVVPRWAFSSRLSGAVVTVSDNSDMSDATTAIASTSAARTGVEAVDWAFTAPITGRYVRVTSPTKDNWIDFSEAEPYADAPVSSDFALAIAQAGYSDAQPQITLTMPGSKAVDSWMLQRSFASTGPWDAVATGDASMNIVVDTVPKTVGADYYYRATFVCRTRSGTSVQCESVSGPYRLPRCIERDWTNQTSLYDGVSVLADCQNTSAVCPPAVAFDGKFGTHILTPSSPAGNPLAGLDLGDDYYLTEGFVLSRDSGYGINTPISLWGSNETPTNTPAIQTADDPHYTEIFRTTETGGGAAAYMGYWYRFPVPTASQSTTYRYAFFHKNATDAAGSSWGNLSEATFYGYSAADAAAAQLIAPESFAVSRTETGFSLVWTHGYNATAYVLQRKQNDGDWEDIATFGTDVLSTTDEVSAQTGSTIAYRIKVEKDSEIRYSDVFSRIFYVQGNGTGILATYTAPSPAGSADPDEVRLGTNTVTGINISKAEGETIYGGVADNILVEWKGKLIVPFTGHFAFQAKATDGFLLEIDGDLYLTDNNVQSATVTSAASIINDWSTTDGRVTTRTSATISLTAGEHQLRAWWNPTTGAKSCVLYWSPEGTVFEVIPTTQFLPATEPDPETYGAEDWRYKAISSAHGYIHQVLDDRFVISEYGKKNATARSFRDGSFCWKKISSHSFMLEADVYAPQQFDQWGVVFVSKNLNGGFSGDDATLSLYRRARKDGVNVRYRTGAGTGQPGKLLETDFNVAPGTTDPGFIWLRIVRRGSHFEMRARQGNASPGGVAAGANGQWKTVATYDDTEGRFGDDVYVGFCSTADSGSWVYQGRYTFSNVRLRPCTGVAIILK